MKDFISFFIEFLKNKKAIGSVIPSSKYLAQKVVEINNDFSGLKVLEIGAGTGVITQVLLKKDYESLFILEPNKTFFSKLSYLSNNKTILVNDYIQNFQEKDFDIIICSIPFNSLPEEISLSILKKIRSLLKNEESSLVFYEYLGLNLFNNKNPLNLIKKEAKYTLEFKNIPPAKILKLSKKQLEKINL